jgi:isopenicillin N synthase-like dioxygenase
VFTLANEFFARSAAEKHRYACPAWVEGYRELGPEYSQVPERPDLTESFSAWNRNRARHELEAWAAGCPLHGALRHASSLLEHMMRDLFAAMAEYFAPGAPELRFHKATYIQLNYYEPARHSRELLQDPHEDGHLVTLVQTNAPGLEIEVDGEFVPADVGRDELLVMPSSLLSLMTGYRVKPLHHQVRNSRRTDPRSSLLYFVNPEIDQALKPWVENESNRGIDIIERANAAPKQFGMPTLQDSLAGQAETRQHEPALADAAQ